MQFELDDRRRWSLWYYGDGSPVPLVRSADIVAWVGDQPITLAELEDSTVGNRRPPGGNAVVVRGRVAGIWVEAEFLTDADRLLATVTVTLFPDRFLPTVTAVRFFKVPHAEMLAGNGPLTALVNGLSSSDPCRVVTSGGGGSAPETGDVESHGAVGLTRGGSGLAIAFDGGEPGQARVKLSSDGIEAVSDWRPPRPLRPEGDSSRMQLCFDPDGNGLEALTALFVPASRLDQERLWQAVAPTGWCSRSELSGAVNETDVIANVEFCAARFDRRFFRHIELDDGYQTAAGTWEPNERFPHGHRWLTDQIHAKGFKAGLWLAPFAVAEGSGVPAAHPDWLLRDASGPIVCDTREAWGGTVYALDGANPKVQQWLFDLARKVVQTWGYDHVRVDMLRWATLGTAHYGGLTHAEAYRAGLGAIRDGLGTEAFLVASGAPLQHAIGLVNGMRIGPDVTASWTGIQPAARAAGLRSFYHRGAWLNDPDCLVVRPPLSRPAAELWASLVAVSGGLTMFSDHLPKLPADRVEMLQRTLPVAGVSARPVAMDSVERQAAPGLTAGGDVYALRGPWRFRTGDDPKYGSREFDEAAWETIAVPARWDEAGHPGYVGVAWYRARLPLPQKPSGATDRRGVRLELGKIADTDETYVNGVKVGQTSDPQAFRRYSVSPDVLNWGGENVVAVRVSGGGAGGGGIWSVRRDLPHRIWVTEGASRWWTAVLINWEDESQDVSVPLAALGISGNRFDAYDVWRDAPSPAPTEILTFTLEAQSARVIAIRPAAARPQIIGSTRHVVQGAVDIADETWDQTTRTLKAKATNPDGRAYAVTISVPKGLTPGACKADVPCSVKRLASGHAVLEWASGGDGRDIRWELSFRPTAARKKRKS